jgi:hypothetical protein
MVHDALGLADHLWFVEIGNHSAQVLQGQGVAVERFWDHGARPRFSPKRRPEAEELAR